MLGDSRLLCSLHPQQHLIATLIVDCVIPGQRWVLDLPALVPIMTTLTSRAKLIQTLELVEMTMLTSTSAPMPSRSRHRIPLTTTSLARPAAMALHGDTSRIGLQLYQQNMLTTTLRRQDRDALSRPSRALHDIQILLQGIDAPGMILRLDPDEQGQRSW